MFRVLTRGVLLVALLAGLAGCPTAPPRPAGKAAPTSASPAPETPAVSSAKEQCEGLMLSLHQIFDLQTLDIQGDVNDGLHDLNRWLTNCAPASTLKDPIPASLTSLTPEERSVILGLRFTTPDGEHLRTTLVTKAQSNFSGGTAETPLDQVAATFEYVVRNIDVVPADQAPALTPHEVSLVGRGTAFDRAWLFAGILRQLKIDSVLLYSSGESAAGTGASGKEPGLVAVLLKVDDKPQVYLFDPLRGVAVRTEARFDAPLATLAQVSENPALLEQLPDSGWTGETLKSADVGLIGSLSLYSPRMAQLQNQFTGDRSMVVSDPLVDTDFGPGYVSRVLAGYAGWKPESLTLWTYEDTTLDRQAKLTAAEKQAVEKALSPRLAPMEPEVDQNGVIAVDDVGHARFKTPQRHQWRGRLNQLAGDFGNANTEYIATRKITNDIKKKPHWPIESKLRELFVRAGEDSWYFTAVSQFEQKNYESALKSFNKLLELHPEGVWINQSHRFIALCEAALGRTAEAVETLKKLPADDPQKPWADVRSAQWAGTKVN